MRLTTVTLSAPEPLALAQFYGRLLGWPVVADPDEPDWVAVRDPSGGVGVAVQEQTGFRSPVWPAGPDEQQMQAHLEIGVDDLEGAVAHALAAGATLAQVQPQDDVRVCLDPAGHPFCLWRDERMLGAGAGEG